MPRLTTTLTIEIAGHAHDYEALVEYTAHGPIRGARDSLGVPQEPDERARVEIAAVSIMPAAGLDARSAFRSTAQLLTSLLTDAQRSALEAECLENEEAALSDDAFEYGAEAREERADLLGEEG